MIQQSPTDRNTPRLKLRRVPIRARILDYLRAAGGRRVTIDELVRDVLDYRGGADPTARAVVHTHVTYLRRALPAGVTVRYRREQDAEGYELLTKGTTS